MHFEAGAKAPKATLKIGDVTYNFRAPTRGEAEQYSELLEKSKDDTKALQKLMDEYMAKLGSVPVDELKKLESDTFYDLFSYVVSPAKKN